MLFRAYHSSNRLVIRFLSLCGLFLCIQASAQQYNYLHYGLKEGLVQSQVKSLYQDSRGFLWAGTVGGVSRFDGRDFLNYTRQEGLLSNQVNVITEDHFGSIVLGGSGVVSFINGVGIRNIPLPSPMEDATINALLYWQDTLWIGTEKGLCYLIEDHIIQLENDVKDANIKAMVPLENQSALYVLTKECVWKMEGLRTFLHHSPMVSTTQFFDMAPAGGDMLWLASKGEGLIKLSADGHYAQNYLEHTELITTNITSVVPAQDGSLWLSSRNGYFRFDGARFEVFDSSNGLTITDVRDLLVDRENNLWIATYGGGLKRLASREMVSYTKQDGLSSNAVMSIAEDGSSGYWLSTFDGGLQHLQGDTIVTMETGALNSRTWCSLADSHGRFWFGTSEGLILKSERWVLLTEEDGLNDNLVLSLAEDAHGRIWIGTSKGVCYYDQGSIGVVQGVGAPKSRVRSMAIDKQQRIWMATLDGVYVYQDTTFRHYGLADGLPELSTYCIAIDAHNRAWAGTAFGLGMWNGTGFENRLISDVNGGNVINFITFHKGKVWLGSNEGIYIGTVLSPSPLREYTFKHFDLDDGLISNETNLNSAYIDSHDRLWFGTSDGLMFLPTELLEKPAVLPPGLHLFDLQINLTKQDWNSYGLQRDAITGLPLGLHLPYHRNDLTFYFTGVSITYPKTVEYQYMLEGLDEDWKPVTPNAFATYSALPNSAYTFVVRTRHKGGEWSPPVTYSFVIDTPFWKTWWFITSISLLLACGIGWLIYNRYRILRVRREKESYQLKSRLLALEQQSLNSSMNRHFIFNALNSIQYYINRQDRLAANKYLSDFAKLIRKNLDSSQDNLTTLGDEIERLEIYLRLEHMRFKEKFEYSVEVDPRLLRDKIKVPAMLIQPFLENSIWHGLLPKEDGEVGRLVVKFSLIDAHVELEITDNGIGIENSLKRKTGADSHISKGMQITQHRIDLIKKTTGKTIELIGPEDIKSNTGASIGTIVKIKLSEDFHELF
jgi:ligand-binding sensor domain-containing protein/two-component sensor histidine kinase